MFVIKLSSTTKRTPPPGTAKAVPPARAGICSPNMVFTPGAGHQLRQVHTAKPLVTFGAFRPPSVHGRSCALQKTEQPHPALRFCSSPATLYLAGSYVATSTEPGNSMAVQAPQTRHKAKKSNPLPPRFLSLSLSAALSSVQLRTRRTNNPTANHTADNNPLVDWLARSLPACATPYSVRLVSPTAKPRPKRITML